MPIIGIALAATREFESKYDSAAGTPEATKFTLGTLDSRVYGMLKDKSTSLSVDPSNPGAEVLTNINANEVGFLTVCFGLKGWENFNDGDGKAIKFKTINRALGGSSYKIADPSLVSLIPEVVIAELAAEIRKDNELSEAEAKN